MSTLPPVLYCCCQYANVVPENVKKEIMQFLLRSDMQFLAVPDLCEMASNCDPLMKSFADRGKGTIVACYPRAVQALFESADVTLNDETTRILNMRTTAAETIVKILSETL